ncbi:MAG: putative two-component system sensor kinase [Gemmatimonadetes bacterium]|nr:putative two-component system sensor kinase [Gemmatimonadota bacterium]
MKTPGEALSFHHMPAEEKPSAQIRLERLLYANLSLATEMSVDRVLQKVTDVAVELIGCRYAALGVLGADGRALESFTTTGITAEHRQQIGALPRGHGILGLVIREATVVRLPDLRKHPDSYGFPPNHPPMHSFLGVPIIGRRGVFGNLYMTEKLGGGAFTDEDEYVGLLLAAQAAAAVENARLHGESARLLEEVQGLQRTRERFFAMVNHELRNAIAGVYGWAEMMVRKKDPATVPRAAFEVLDSAGQAVELINDLLDLSRLDEDRLRPNFQAVDPATVARRAISHATPAAAHRNIELRTELAAAMPTCRTDAMRVEQILGNVINNAVRHAPNGSVVLLRVAPAGDSSLLFRVEDSGPGVPEADLERIFDVYETKAGEEVRGVGLGLPLSRRLARLLGGDLYAEASDGGGGGHFVLRLPQATSS